MNKYVFIILTVKRKRFSKLIISELGTFIFSFYNIQVNTKYVFNNCIYWITNVLLRRSLSYKIAVSANSLSSVEDWRRFPQYLYNILICYRQYLGFNWQHRQGCKIKIFCQRICNYNQKITLMSNTDRQCR